MSPASLAAHRILWLDLETTGLDPYADSILEIGCVITDGALVEIDRRAWVTHLPPRFRDGRVELDPYVRKMHTRNGLLIEAEHAPSVAEVTPLVLAFLERCGVTKKTPLAGNSVGDFDRHFLRNSMPAVNAGISHRSINCSTLRLLFGLYAQHVALPSTDREVAHRSLADCDSSIADFKAMLPLLGHLSEGFQAALEGVGK